MMRILVFSWRDTRHPNAGGAEQVMHEHMKGWIESGHTVTLFASRFKLSKRRETIDGVLVVRGGHQYLGVQLAGFLYYLKNRKMYDVLVDQFHGIPFFTTLYSSKPKVAVIQEISRNVWFLNPLRWPFNKLVGTVGYFGEKYIFYLYRNVLFMTGSRSAADDLMGMGIRENFIKIVPHGFILPENNTRQRKGKVKTIIFLGILARDKGIEDAIEAFGILRKKDDYKFWIVGKGETEGYLEKIRTMANRVGLGKDVKFWGFVSQKKKFELLGRAHLLVNPSFHEGWGLVNIEANSVGTPVVSYKSAGLVDSVKDGQSGMIVRKNSSEELAFQVEQVLSDKEVYKKLSYGALKWSKKFDWSSSKKISLRLIESLV